MNSREERLLEQLKCYTLIQEDIERLQELIASAEYGVTPAYSLVGGRGGGLPGSKVETMAIQKLENQTALDKRVAVIHAINEALEHAGLNKREKDLIDCTIKGYSLSAYARTRNIYKSHVYKLRDNALRKMDRYIHESTK